MARKGEITPPEVRAKISRALKGRPLAPETREKLRGKVASAETRAKIAANSRGRVLSAESRAKVAAAKIGKPLSAEHRAAVSAGRLRWAESHARGWVDKDGYRWLRRDGRSIQEHRYTMEQHLGRALNPEEHVHHKNGDRQDNRLENLQLMTRSEHASHHNLGKTRGPDSEETRARKSRAMKGRVRSPEHCAAIAAGLRARHARLVAERG